MKITKILQLRILGICTLCFTALLHSCSGDDEITPHDENAYEMVNNHMVFRFENDTVFITPDVIERNENCEAYYEMLHNGDYIFTYYWPYQTATIWVHNTDKCQFGCPDTPQISFSVRKGKIYNAEVTMGINYVNDNTIKSVIVSRNFTAVVSN